MNDRLDENTRDLLGTVVESMLPNNKRFVLLVAGIDGPTALEIIANIPKELSELMCRWGADVISGNEGADTLEMIRSKGGVPVDLQ